MKPCKASVWAWGHKANTMMDWCKDKSRLRSKTNSPRTSRALIRFQLLETPSRWPRETNLALDLPSLTLKRKRNSLGLLEIKTNCSLFQLMRGNSSILGIQSRIWATYLLRNMLYLRYRSRTRVQALPLHTINQLLKSLKTLNYRVMFLHPCFQVPTIQSVRINLW